ncbi:MAG TPA: TSUP family transporter [Burkholderiales bacterium]|nr:TSUP family transporter [Burkholderiales bacterium]
MDYALLGYLLVGSLPGIYLGSHLSRKFPEKILRPVLASILILIGGRLMW